MKFEFSRQTFEKFSYFMKICSMPAELFMRTDRLTNRERRFLQFCECV